MAANKEMSAGGVGVCGLGNGVVGVVVVGDGVGRDGAIHGKVWYREMRRNCTGC